MNRYAILADLDYFIFKKAAFVSKLELEQYKREQNHQEKDISLQNRIKALYIELNFLKKLEETIGDLADDNNKLDIENCVLKKENAKLKISTKENRRIVKGLKCALNYYSLLKNSDSERRFIVNRLLNDPEYFINLWKDTIFFLKQGETEINWIIENLPYNNLRARDILKTTCETYGYIYELKLAKWKQRADKNNQNQR